MAAWRAFFAKTRRLISHLLPSSSAFLPSRFSPFPVSLQHEFTSPILCQAASDNGSFITVYRMPGDLDCPTCLRLDFRWHETCQRYRDPRPRSRHVSHVEEGDGYTRGSGLRGGSCGNGEGDARPREWDCPCGTLNFSSRTVCFKCGRPKDEGDDGEEGGYQSGVQSSSGGDFGFISSHSRGNYRSWFKPGDWICSRAGCNQHNFASRMECFRCQAPRDSGSGF